MTSSKSTSYAEAELLSDLLDTLSEGVVVQSSTGATQRSNRAAREILGVSELQLAERGLLSPSFRHVRESGELLDPHEHPTAVTLRTGNAQRAVLLGSHRPDGQLVWLELSTAMRRSEHGVLAVLTTFRDVSSQRAATARSAHQERLATIGMLAAGIAHEINNPLTYVMANLEQATADLRAPAKAAGSLDPAELLELITLAREGTDRIRRVVRSLQGLSRNETKSGATRLATSIEEATGITAHEIRKKATLVVGNVDVPDALADATLLTQVLVNLLLNASQAFPASDPATNRIHVDASRKGEHHVTLTVRDNGPGVPEALRERIFQPFFTTKTDGQGTGLGLAISKTIAESLGGKLYLEPRGGGGAAFSIVLPVASEPAAPPSLAHKRGRVVVVDADAAILATIRRILRDEHQVVTMSDSRAARALLIERGDVDLVLCEASMPYLSGGELYEQVVQQRPALAERFVFLTGGAPDPSARALLARIGGEYLEKPFAIQTLLDLARRFVT